MASTFFATKRSENLARTPEGFLLARGVTIARTGFQRYEVHELPQDRVEALGITGNGYVDVYRPPEQVFDPRTIASGEGKTITLFHPPDFVGPENYRDFARGHIQNVHKGSEALESGEWPLVADLLVTDVGAIQAIDNGQRELSCGYEYDLGREGNVLVQTNIIINHLAIVPNGRAGPEARINDEAIVQDGERDSKLDVTIENVTPDQGRQFKRLFAWLNRLGNWGASREIKLFYDGDGAARAQIKVDGKLVEPDKEDKQHDEHLHFGFDSAVPQSNANDYDYVEPTQPDQSRPETNEKGEYNMSKILDRILGLGLQKLATDEKLAPEQYAEAARAVHRATDSEEESEESKKSKEAEDRRMKDAEEEKKKEEDRKAKDAAEMEGLKKRATDAETEVEKLKKEAEDRKAKDAEAAKGEHFKPCTMKDCSARDCRMHDALGGILEKHPEAEDADVQDLEKLLREFRAEEAQEPEHQDAEVGSEVIEPIQEDEEMVEPIQTGDAKARDSEYQWLRANAKKIADSNDKKQIAAFNARQRAYYGTSRASTGSYGSFGAAAQARGKDVKQQQYQEQQVTEMQKAMNARLGRPVGSIQKEVVN